MHVSQALQRVWKAVSSSLLQCWNSEAGLCFLQAVHLYGHASGAQSWHILRPSELSRSWLLWNALWHELQARKRYFSCRWQALQTSDSVEKYPTCRCCLHRVHSEVEVLGGTC